MLDYGDKGNKYRNTDPWPNKDDYKIYYVYKEGQCLLSFGYSQCNDNKLAEFCKENGFVHESYGKTYAILERKKFVVEMVIHEGYKAAEKEWTNKANDLVQQWYDDVYKYYNLDKDNPIVKLIMSKAYDDGHSSGYQEVEHYVDKYLDFAGDILEYANPKFKLS
jgi:hypothetical protein